MQVILLQRVGRIGQMGDVVNVKDGFARNFLLPQKKALRATKENLAKFEGQRAQLEANNLELKKEAEAVAAKLDGQSFITIRSAGDTGQLYGLRLPRATSPKSSLLAASPSTATRSSSTSRSRRSDCTAPRSSSTRKCWSPSPSTSPARRKKPIVRPAVRTSPSSRTRSSTSRPTPKTCSKKALPQRTKPKRPDPLDRLPPQNPAGSSLAGFLHFHARPPP